MTDKERDDALIDEKRKLSNIMEAITKLGTVGPWNDDLLRAAAILRGDEQPKPDRAKALAWMIEGLFAEAADNPCTCASDENSCPHCNAWERATKQTRACIVEAIDELRAEWEAERPAVVVPSEDQIKQMVTRFLCWKLPEDFHPDAGISFSPFFNVEYNAKQGKPPNRHTPSGTNLFDATQTEAMVRYIIDGAKGDE